MNDHDDDDSYVYSYRDCPALEDLYAPCATPFDRLMRDLIHGPEGEDPGENEHAGRVPILLQRVPAHFRDAANPFLDRRYILSDSSKLRLPSTPEVNSTLPISACSTSGITLTQLQDAHNALSAANCLGFPFNCYVDLNWRAKELADEAEAEAEADAEAEAEAGLQKFTKAFSGWVRRKAGTLPFFIFVFERSQARGVHCHGMIHVPLHHCEAFKSWFSRYGKTVRGSSYSPQAWRVRARRDFSETHQLIRFCYLMKGVDRDARIGPLNPSDNEVPVPISKFLRLSKGYRDAGALSIKRVRFCRGLSPAFLKKHRFRSSLDIRTGDVSGFFNELGVCWFEDRLAERLLEELEQLQL